MSHIKWNLLVYCVAGSAFGSFVVGRVDYAAIWSLLKTAFLLCFPWFDKSDKQ